VAALAPVRPGAALHRPGPAPATPGRPPLLRPGWPLRVVLLGFPLWWALGLAGVVWFAAGAVLLVTLLRLPRVRVPRGFGVWLLFLLWMLVSGLQIDSPERWLAFGYRAVAYGSATVWFLAVYSTPAARLPTRRVVTALLLFAVVVVAGGWLGVLAPGLEFASPVERLLPARLLANGFVYELVHPASAATQEFLGYPVARPKAPFPYTNDWGGALGLLVPVTVLALAWLRSPPLRLLAAATLLLAAVPALFSLNRALWAGLVVAAAYVAVRLALRGRPGGLVATVVAVAVLAVVLAATPLRALVADRVATPHSNDARASIYAVTVEKTLASPWLGYGGPRPFADRPLLPSLGTQGQLWLVLFSHGFVGLALFLPPVVGTVWGTRRWTSWPGMAAHAALVVALVQLPFYDFLPSQFHLAAVIAALGLREQRDAHG
jgi:hypothetical protein